MRQLASMVQFLPDEVFGVLDRHRLTLQISEEGNQPVRFHARDDMGSGAEVFVAGEATVGHGQDPERGVGVRIPGGASGDHPQCGAPGLHQTEYLRELLAVNLL